MAGVTLDAGALIAADRNDRRFWIWWKYATSQGVVATVPTPVIAQAWRGKANARMAQVLNGCRHDPMDTIGARRAGELCGLTGKDDIVDAFVVESASRRADVILTGDPSDLTVLAAHRPTVRIKALSTLQ